MHEPLPLQRFDAVEDAERVADRFAERQRPAREPAGQRLPLQQLHREKQLAVVLADLVELADGRMVDAGRRIAPRDQPLARRGIVDRRA